MDSSKDEGVNGVHLFGFDDDVLTQIPTQAQSIVEGSGSWRVPRYKPVTDADYLQVCHFYLPKSLHGGIIFSSLESVWVLQLRYCFLMLYFIVPFGNA